MASSAFARHYSRNHNCFLFLRVLRCFTSPRSLQLPYIFRQRLPDMTPVFQGFPIRKSTDQSLFTNSPWLIAGYNVLLRLLVPRHPPIALSSLLIYKDARVHCEVLKIRASPDPPTTHKRQKADTGPQEGAANATDPSGPNSVLQATTNHPCFPLPQKREKYSHEQPAETAGQCSTFRCFAQPGTNVPEPDNEQPDKNAWLPKAP